MTREEWLQEHGSDEMLPHAGPYGELCDHCGDPLEQGEEGAWVPGAGGKLLPVHDRCLAEWVSEHMDFDTIAYAMGLERWWC